MISVFMHVPSDLLIMETKAKEMIPWSMLKLNLSEKQTFPQKNFL